MPLKPSKPPRRPVALRRPARPRGRWLLLGTVAVALLLSGRGPEPAAAQIAPPPSDADRLLVVPQSGVTEEQVASALEALGIAVDHTSQSGAVPVPVPPGSDPAVFARRIAALLGAPLASWVESDDIVRAQRVPLDPLYAAQQSPYLEVVRAPEAWEIETGRPGVTVAVIDTGLDFSHGDLRQRWFINAADPPGNGLDDDRNGCIDDQIGCTFLSPETTDPSCGQASALSQFLPRDDEGHGTFVAGLIAAAGDDALGIAGVAWDVRILPVKVLDCTATGRISDAAAGIRYAARTGADVINISFGTTRDSRTLGAAIDEAIAAGAIVVAAAGNRAQAVVDFPARHPGVIAVGGADGARYDRPAPFSPTGSGVELFAPATALVAPLPATLCGQRGWVCLDAADEGSAETYAVASGTSFAAPLVSGAAALLRSHHPEISAPLLRALLRGGARPLDAGGPDAGPSGLGGTTRGFGIGGAMLDIAGALERPLYRAGLPGTSRAPGDGPIRSPR